MTDEVISATEGTVNVSSVDAIPQNAPLAPEQKQLVDTPAKVDHTEAADLDADLKSIWKQSQTERDEQGRFAPRDGAVKAEPQDSSSDHAQEATDATGQQAQSSAPPASWSKEMAAKWATLPPDVREFVSKRESEAHQTITRQGQFVKQYEAVNPVLNRATELARRYGADEPTVLNNLIEANEFLERDPVGGIKWLADLYNVDLSTLATGAMAQDPGAQAFDALQRQNAQLQQKIAEIEQGLQLTRQTTEQREVEAQVAKVRDSFPAVDEQALVRAIHELNGVIAAGLMEHPGPSKLLEKAYEKLGVKPKGDQAQAQARVDAAKKAAPLSVKSSPANTTKVGSLEDTLGEIARRAYR